MVNEQANREAATPPLRATYHSYLIRFWRMDNDGQPVWRVGVEEPGASMPLYFESLAALFAFLTEQLGIAADDTPLPAVRRDRIASIQGGEDARPTAPDQAT
jgi:hypothetical protein